MAGRVVHGEVVARGRGGTLVTVDAQRGAVVQVSATAIDVRSTDGFRQRYVVNADTKLRKDKKPANISDVKTGDVVRVVATRSGSTRTAKAVVVGAPKKGG
jgi:hypothetical protein